MRTEQSPEIEIRIRGRSELTRQRFRDALERAVAKSRRPVIFVRGSLERDPNPSVDEPVHAEAAVDLGQCSVHAQATARTQTEAINLLVHRLRRELRKQRSRQRTKRRRPSRDALAGEPQ